MNLLVPLYVTQPDDQEPWRIEELRRFVGTHVIVQDDLLLPTRRAAMSVVSATPSHSGAALLLLEVPARQILPRLIKH